MSFLFGGSDEYGNDQNDTWTWDGLNWTQQNPANPPAARDGGAMAYDPALGQVVLFGGEQNPQSPNYINDTWVWSGTTWTSVNFPNSPGARYAYNQFTYDAAQNQLILFGGSSTSTTFDDTWAFGPPQNFGSINVCQSGAPAPCSNTLTLTYTVSGATYFGTPKVVVQGAAGSDFTLASGSTCIPGAPPSGTCTVNVTFTPQAPGLRTGAVELFDAGSNLLATSLIYGVGQAPEAAFGPTMTGTYPAVTYSSQVSALTTLTGYSGFTTDAFGNLYHLNGPSLYKLAPPYNSTPATVATGFTAAYSVAIDGAGNFYVADPEFSPDGAVVKLPPGCTSATATCASVIYAPSSHPGPVGVAVDELGNIFIAQNGTGVFEIPVNGGPQFTLYNPPGNSLGGGMAVDAAGDLFVADSGLHQVVEIPAGCTTTSCQTLIGSGWASPQDVAVDAAGDVIVADVALTINGTIDAGGVVEVPAGCTTPSCQILLWTSGGAYDPSEVAVTPTGQIFFETDGTPVYEINQAQPPSLNFGTTTEAGTVSSPLADTIQNIGNQALSITGLSIGLPFDQVLNQNDNPADCGAGSFALTLGQICALNISFEPPAPNAQTYSADVSFADNSLNLPYSPIQQLPLAGTATAATVSYTLQVTDTGSGSGSVTDNLASFTCSEVDGSPTGFCSASYQGGYMVTLTATPAAGSTFTGWGGACASSGTNLTCTLTMNSSLNVSANFVQGDFGSVNVCAGGSPSGCTGSTIPVTFNFTAASTPVSQILAFTLGSTGLDFSAPNSGQCIGGFTPGQSCTVNVTFTPTAPGLRRGAVELLDDLGNVLLTQPVSGIGQGPLAVFSPGNQTTVSAVGMNYPVGVALDGAGDLYIANYGNGNGGTQPASHPGYVLKVAPGGAQTTVLSSYTSAPGQVPSPIGVAVDGAGNLFVVDLYLPYAVKVTPSGVQTTVGSGLNFPVGIALDGAGDVFIGDQNNRQVVEVTPGGVQTTVPFTGLQQPWGVAVDAAGDVFVADGGNQSMNIPPSVQKITSGGVQTTVPTSGLGQPYDIAVDAAGDVYIADAPTGRLLEVTPGGVQSNVSPTILNYPSGVTVDAAGDVFIADQGVQTVYEINGSSPLVSFDVGQGYQSPDSPVSVQNVGNQTLSGTVGQVSSAYIVEDTVNSNCNSFTLAPAASCVNNYYATSTAPLGLFSGSAVATDNSLNGSPATQTINFTGLSYGPTEQVSVAAGGTGGGLVYSNLTGLNCNMNAGDASGPTCSYGFTSGFNVTLYAIPSNGSAFTSWGGACASVGTGGPSGGTCILFIPESATNVTANFTSTAAVAVPNVVGSTQVAATTAITTSTLVVGTVTTQYSDTVPSGTVISESPIAGTIVSGGTTDQPRRLRLARRLHPINFRSRTITLSPVTMRPAESLYETPAASEPSRFPARVAATGVCGPGVPDGADIVAAYLYWEAIENTTLPSSANATFLGYSVTGLQIGSDVSNYNDGANTGTLRAYRADVNNYFPLSSGPNPVRTASGNFTVSLPDGGPTQQIPEGASLVVIYRVMSPNFPLKSVVLYNGLVTPTATTGQIPQAVQGFYDAVGGASGTGEVTDIYAGSAGWNNISNSQTLGQSNQYIETLNTGSAYAAVVLSTPVNNSDGDGILDVWKANQGYTDVNTGLWVPLPGATSGEKDLFVQFDYMCSAFAPDGVTCDFTQPNLYPSPDANGNDPLAMVTQAFLNIGVHLHLKPGNAIPENTYTCTDPNPANGSLCEFPSTTSDPQPGVVPWNGGVELSKVWPANFNACTTSPSAETCTPRFPFGQKDSYHYVLFGYSLAIPAWNSWFGSLTGITVSSTQTSIQTTGLGSTCPSRITISGVQGNPALNGVYNTSGCDSGLTTIYLATPSGVTSPWSYPNKNLPEPVIGITSGTVTSISGYSNVGGSDSVVSLGYWATNTNQDMSKSATVVAGTLFHELGHTLGLNHGGRYYDTPGSYVPTFEANCKPNYQSSMNYLFQLDGVGPNGAIAYSNQTLTELTESSLNQVAQLSNTDVGGGAATFTTSSWYTPTAPSPTTSAATMHCDGSPLADDTGYRVNGPITSSPGWSNGQNITFDEPNSYTQLRGYNDLANLDLRQVGATSDQFASLANATSYGSRRRHLRRWRRRHLWRWRWRHLRRWRWCHLRWRRWRHLRWRRRCHLRRWRWSHLRRRWRRHLWWRRWSHLRGWRRRHLRRRWRSYHRIGLPHRQFSGSSTICAHLFGPGKQCRGRLEGAGFRRRSNLHHLAQRDCSTIDPARAAGSDWQRERRERKPTGDNIYRR